MSRTHLRFVFSVVVDSSKVPLLQNFCSSHIWGRVILAFATNTDLFLYFDILSVFVFVFPQRRHWLQVFIEGGSQGADGREKCYCIRPPRPLDFSTIRVLVFSTRFVLYFSKRLVLDFYVSCTRDVLVGCWLQDGRGNCYCISPPFTRTHKPRNLSSIEMQWMFLLSWPRWFFLQILDLSRVWAVHTWYHRHHPLPSPHYLSQPSSEVTAPQGS